ncbi:MAG: hypothetical protein IT430_11875 [Phycisphaerales bacterium]|nr:hypothetical protein [Phycisphaerales bacterium]
MTKHRKWCVALSAILASALLGASGARPGDDDGWTRDFPAEPGELVATGRNPYFILEPGYQLVFEGGDERLVITVLDETRIIDGVETRIVEERETKSGQLIEVSRNFFAISKRTNSVFYFGEEVDLYRDGQISGHEGAWISGRDGAKYGLMMPGQILLGGRYYQEIAPEVAMDRAEIINTSSTIKCQAGQFAQCLKVEETTPLEPDEKEYKYYAAGIGLVQDGSVKLVRYGKADLPEP